MIFILDCVCWLWISYHLFQNLNTRSCHLFLAHILECWWWSSKTPRTGSLFTALGRASTKVRAHSLLRWKAFKLPLISVVGSKNLPGSPHTLIIYLQGLILMAPAMITCLGGRLVIHIIKESIQFNSLNDQVKFQDIIYIIF